MSQSASAYGSKGHSVDSAAAGYAVAESGERDRTLATDSVREPFARARVNAGRALPRRGALQGALRDAKGANQAADAP